MKPNIKREAAIGLSVLLVLLVILGVIAVRRFMQPSTTLEAAVAVTETKTAEAPSAHSAKQEMDSSQKPALLTPVAAPGRDSLQPLDDPGHWNTMTKETKTETPVSSLASSPIASDPPTTASSKSMVIQVGGSEPAVAAPRPLDRYAAAGSPVQLVPLSPSSAASDTIPSAPAVGQPLVSSDGPVLGSPVDPSATHSAYVAVSPPSAPASRTSYDPPSPAPAGNVPANYSSVPPSNAPANYSATPGGYAPDNLPRPGGAVSGPMPTPMPRGDGKYEVQPNDSYWTISERVYGNGAYFRALAEQNRGKTARPDRLSPGLVISTPPVVQLEKDYGDLCPRPNRREAVRNRTAGAASMASTAGGGRSYLVQEGDTLSSIARNELGKVSRWAEIYQLNREALGKSYDYLTPGMRLVLPLRDSQPGDRTTRRTDDGAPLLR